jgi:hypothetical protein
MAAPPAIEDLVRRFEEQRPDYQSTQYNETQVRREFIDPLFEALGWDVANRAGRPEAFKDVVHEDRVLVGGALRAPDYSFRLGGHRQFLLEAKKPSVNLHDAPSPAFQLRRYAWSAQLPVSVLSDFEELAVYDCRQEPTLADDAATARLLYFTCPEYISRWDEIADLFSREAVVAGSLEAYRQSLKVKRGTAEVDGSFLREIEGWRALLAKDLAKGNHDLTERNLNFAVQQTIDRIVFLRIAEDRGLEPYGSLGDTLETSDVYQQLVDLFRRADSRYNSGLFHFAKEAHRASEPDLLTPELSVSDAALGRIIGRLYYPNSPYEFSVIPTRVLGQVYEQFLGEVISLDAQHRARVEKKPEVKKAGGVYYTPSPIVDFIVESTLGDLIADRTPAQISGEGRGRNAGPPVRILDPACGSGSFLIGSYEYLLDWYLQAYLGNPTRWARGKEPRLVEDHVGEWRLSIGERKRILRTHVFGVDIDPQAVEVTKLSLLLKVLEGESEASSQQLFLHHERALPDLDQNIKCGNSLVDLDIYGEQQLDLLDEERRHRLNAFSWSDEFPTAADAGGYDVVLGNPPYIDSELMTQVMPEVRTYCTKHLEAASGNWDIFCAFIDRALALSRTGGRHGFIVPNKLASAEYAEGARQVLATRARLLAVRDYSRIGVFPVSVYPLVYVAERSDVSGNDTVEVERMAEGESGLVVVAEASTLDRSRAFARGTPWLIYGGSDRDGPLERLRDDLPSLGELAQVSGAATVAEAYEIAELVADGGSPVDPGDLKMVNSGTIDPYVFHWTSKALRYLGSSYTRAIIPAGEKGKLPKRRLEQAESPKVVLAGMTRNLEAAADLDGAFLAGKSTTVVISDHDPRLLVVLLNSSLVNWYYAATWGGNRLQGGYLRIGPPQVRRIPIPELDSQQALVDTLVGLADTMIGLQAKHLEADTPDTRSQLDRVIGLHQSSIDEAVVKLYGLSEAEAAVVAKGSGDHGG